VADSFFREEGVGSPLGITDNAVINLP
jgi:hypothetical protein